MDTRITVDGHTIRVLAGAYMDGAKAKPEAESFARRLIKSLPKMKKFATRELLDTYNDSWADDEHEELTAEQFEANLTSPQIVIYDEVGAATVYFEDSDMFAGHSIDISIYEGKISDASLIG